MKDALPAIIGSLEERVAMLERRQAQTDHRHYYSYSKTMTQDRDTWSSFWSWKCLDAEGEISRVCPQPSGGTNHLGGLPDHFPSALR